MSAGAFREALRTLEWTPSEAAEALGVANYQRVNEWLRGARRVPPYVASAIRTHLELRECREQLP